MEAASNVLWTFSTLADGCVTAVSLLLRLNELVGAVLLSAVLRLCSVVAQISTSLYHGLYYACRDFVYFLEDIVVLVRSVVSAVDCAVHGITVCVLLAYTSIIRAIVFIYDVITSTWDLIVAGLFYVSSSVSSLVSLLLGSTLLLLQLLPFAVCQTALYAYSSAVSVLTGVVATPTPLPAPGGAPTTSATTAVEASRPGPLASVHDDTAIHQRRDRLQCLERELEQEREKQLCVVCQDEERCVILLPCGHFALCVACMETLLEMQPTCPVCRHFINRVVRVYA
ncbi:E3 ubiquitin-protein ligase RNF26 [Ixodes scapularis]